MNVKFVSEPCLAFPAGLGNMIQKAFKGDIVTITMTDNSPNSIGSSTLLGRVESMGKKEMGLRIEEQNMVVRVPLNKIIYMAKN